MRTFKRVLLVAASVVLMFALLLISTQAALTDETAEDGNGEDSTAAPHSLGMSQDEDVVSAAVGANAAGASRAAAPAALINDGSFENIPSAWIEQHTTDCYPWINDWQLTTGVLAYHGSYYFWAGGACGPEEQKIPNSNSAEQRVTVPITETTLSFWYYAERVDPDDVDPVDYAYVEVGGTLVWYLQMTQANNTNGWVNARVDLSRYAGQTTLLKFGAYNDPETGVGNVFFDFVEFKAPSSVIRIIDPELGGVLTYTDAEGYSTIIEVPPGAVSETVALAFKPRGSLEPSLPPSLQFANRAFDLDALLHLVYLPAVLSDAEAGPTTSLDVAPGGNTAVTSGAVPTQNGFTFMMPVTITLTYGDEDVAGIDENNLRLYYWTGDSWTDAVTTCGNDYQYNNDPAVNELKVPVCHLSQFGMAG